MVRGLIVGLLASALCGMAGQDGTAGHDPQMPVFDSTVARAHEIGPHRRSIPTKGEMGGFDSIYLKLVVSATGDVLKAWPTGEDRLIKLWPQIEGEVYQWRFTPFEVNGKAVVAEVDEYVGLVPSERIPKVHVKAPEVRPDSKVTITLERTGCYGTCPGYTVTVGTDGTVFQGGYFVVAMGRHTDRVDADEVRALAKRFVAADFYSMDEKYVAAVTDCPTYVLTIAIDGKSKKVVDYVGQEMGMPAVVSELEDAVDELAQTERWIKGEDGLVELLKTEKFNFQSYEAQVILKGAAQAGQSATASGMLAAGVPLKPMPGPKAKSQYEAPPFEHVGWLNAASREPEVLQVLIDAGASRDDQSDKDLALVGAAQSGKISAVRALIAYGANPNADLSKLLVTENGGWVGRSGNGSVLIYAASSGEPEVVGEILKYHPKLETRGWEGQTAIFAASKGGASGPGISHVECVRMLAKAGADVNARDDDGNTALHETFSAEVEEELLKLGADVNAKNKDGETPIFTTYNDDALLLFLEHGADLTIRNKKGQTVLEAAEETGPDRVAKLKEAINLARQKKQGQG